MFLSIIMYIIHMCYMYYYYICISMYIYIYIYIYTYKIQIHSLLNRQYKVLFLSFQSIIFLLTCVMFCKFNITEFYYQIKIITVTLGYLIIKDLIKWLTNFLMKAINEGIGIIAEGAG